MRSRIGAISTFVLTGITMLIAAGWGTLVPRSAGYSPIRVNLRMATSFRQGLPDPLEREANPNVMDGKPNE